MEVSTTKKREQGQNSVYCSPRQAKKLLGIDSKAQVLLGQVLRLIGLTSHAFGLAAPNLVSMTFFVDLATSPACCESS